MKTIKVDFETNLMRLERENKELREQVKDYEQALKFYASKEVWGNGKAEIDYCDVYVDDMNVGIPRGGLRAIEVLKKWGIT